MDTQSVEIDAVEEMEKAAQVPEGHDCGGTRAGSGASGMDTNGSMEVSDAKGSPIRLERTVVQAAWTNLPSGVFTILSLTAGWDC